MKEIFLKFLETQNISTILAEIGVLYVAWQGYQKYKERNKEEQKKTFLKALIGNDAINSHLENLQADFKNKNIIPAVAEITNGGDVPKRDKPLYIRATNSTNSEVLQLWGNKTLVVPSLNTAIIKMVNYGYSFLDIDKFDLKKVEFWAGAKHIERVHYFLIGYRKGKSMTVLAINSENKEELTDEEMLIAHTYAANIKEEYNRNKRFWENKMS